MRFPADFLDDLRARLPVSDVVGRRVSLKKAGREWKGLSPFNKEKTPSFFVNDQKQAWFDFSSGKNGNIFDFVMQTEGASFPEAVERLAAMAGMALPIVSKEAQAHEQRRKSLYEVIELAAKYFEAQLAARAGAAARGYLADRGLDAAAQLKFRLGFASADRFALKEHLGAQGVPVEDMIEAGLLVAGDDIPIPYDRFRDRIMFPITDLRSRVVAFGGRAVAKDAPAKYLNSPETPLFHKGATLYNLATARAAAHQGAPVVVVEGYVDVIAMVGAGYPAAVAPLGTALTEDQLTLLWKMSDEPVLCFDGDAAGRRAAYRVVDLALAKIKAGKSLRFASLPPGQDPDDLARSGGREAVREVIETAAPLAEILWTRETERDDFATPERRAALEARLGAVIEAIGDPIVRKYYRDDFFRRIGRLFGAGAARADKLGREATASRYSGLNRGSHWQSGRGGRSFAGQLPPSPRLMASPVVRGFHAALPPREALILLLVLNHPWLLDQHAEEFAELEFRHADAGRLRRAILDAVAGHTHEPVEADMLRQAIIAAELGPALARVEAVVTHTSDWPVRPAAAADDVLAWWTHVITLHRKQGALHRELKEAERALGDAPNEENLAWLKDIQARLAALEGSEAAIEDFGVSSGRGVRGV